MDKQTYLSKIQHEFPKIKFNNSRLISHGWDNNVIILDNNWVFRFPKRKDYIRRFRAEVALLKYLKEKVNIPIPDYIFLSKNRTFGGYKILKGREMRPYLLKKLPLEKQKVIAKQLGEFLSIIHTTPIKIAKNAGLKNPKEGHWYSQNAVKQRFEKIKKILFPKLTSKEIDWITKQFTDYLNFPPQSQLGVVHGDFVPDHILFDPKKGKITGIIDFADAEMGDPELSFGGLWQYGTTFLKEVAKNHTPSPSPNALEKSKFPMRTHMVWSMYELLIGEDIPISFEECRKQMHQQMK